MSMLRAILPLRDMLFFFRHGRDMQMLSTCASATLRHVTHADGYEARAATAECAPLMLCHAYDALCCLRAMLQEYAAQAARCARAQMLRAYFTYAVDDTRHAAALLIERAAMCARAAMQVW